MCDAGCCVAGHGLAGCDVSGHSNDASCCIAGLGLAGCDVAGLKLIQFLALGIKRRSQVAYVIIYYMFRDGQLGNGHP